MDRNDLSHQSKDPFVPIVVRSFIVIVFASVIVYKIAITPCALQFDSSTFLSFALALFSISLSALFYFRATETSNKFYDNTYKFSRDIGELLARIESGFGERLKHLDDSYTSMRDQLQHYKDPSSVAGAKEEIKKEQQQLQEKLKERDQMIQSLLEKTQMQGGEREEFLKRLKESERQLINARQEMLFLQRRLKHIATPEISSAISELPEHMRRYILDKVIKQIGRDYVLEAPLLFLRRRFQKYAPIFNSAFLNDMKERALLGEENLLTAKGMQVLKFLAVKDSSLGRDSDRATDVGPDSD